MKTNLEVFAASAFFICVVGLEYEGKRKFPKNFKFGAATASYQVEGGWNADGKGTNIWDHITHTNPEFVIDRSNGDIACNSYEFYKSDVHLLKELGVDFYRFSLSWPRILPTGFSSDINKAGVDYYKNLIKELKEHGIEPFVTIYHWDFPQSLQELGGWANPLMADYFEDYARVVFDAFGDDVSEWITFNEPLEVCLSGYGKDVFAPAMEFQGIAEYMCAHTLLISHARVYHLYDSEFRVKQKGRISIAVNSKHFEPDNNSKESKTAAELIYDFKVGWFTHPIFSKDGDYPRVMKETIAKRSEDQGFARSRLPVFTQEEVELIKGTYDFFGLNHYTTRKVRMQNVDAENPSPSHEDDLRVHMYSEDSWETAESTWLKVVPWGFRKLLNWIKETYNNPEVIVFENGFSDKGQLNDLRRVNYYKEYLNALLDAVDDGCNITGYTAWSLMDNFEWKRGYTEHFGLYHVDFNSPNRTRTPKMSAQFYSDVIKYRAI